MRWVGERALLRTFGGDDLPTANRAALGLHRDIVALAAGEIEDVVPGARSLLVVLRAGAEPSAAILEILEGQPSPSTSPSSGPVAQIAVRYGGDDGPDLADVAQLSGLSEREVVERHADVEYVVGFIGFSPGFPYLLGMPPELATPRLESPRVRVAPGSVGIGGPYTGIYPTATPGGWRLIGRCDVELFDASRDPPALLSPGDRVRFVAR